MKTKTTFAKLFWRVKEQDFGSYRISIIRYDKYPYSYRLEEKEKGFQNVITSYTHILTFNLWFVEIRIEWIS